MHKQIHTPSSAIRFFRYSVLSKLMSCSVNSQQFQSRFRRAQSLILVLWWKYFTVFFYQSSYKKKLVHLKILVPYQKKKNEKEKKSILPICRKEKLFLRLCEIRRSGRRQGKIRSVDGVFGNTVSLVELIIFRCNLQTEVWIGENTSLWAKLNIYLRPYRIELYLPLHKNTYFSKIHSLCVVLFFPERDRSGFPVVLNFFTQFVRLRCHWEGPFKDSLHTVLQCYRFFAYFFYRSGERIIRYGIVYFSIDFFMEIICCCIFAYVAIFFNHCVECIWSVHLENMK